METPPPPSRGRDLLAFFPVFALSLGVYTAGLPPSITLEDAGELVVAADYLGVPHPPGYPLWTLLAWFFQWILHPLRFHGQPNPAWAVAFASSVFGALACGLVAVLLRRGAAALAVSAPTVPRLALREHGRARLAGLGGGLLGCLLLRAGHGGVLLAFLGACAALALFQTLAVSEARKPWMRRFPSVGSLGAGLGAALQAALVWAVAWTLLPVPSPGKLLLFSLPGVAALAALRVLLDLLLGVAERRGDFAGSLRACGGDVMLAVGGGLLLAFSPLMASQAVIAEVYSLNALFVALLLLLAQDYLREPTDRRLHRIAFVFALGLTNHQSLLFLVFFLIAIVAASGRKHLLKDGLLLAGVLLLAFFLFKAARYGRLGDEAARDFFLRLGLFAAGFLGLLLATGGGILRAGRTLGTLLLLGGLALSVHLYMPIASEQNPPMNWSYARTPDGFLQAITRGQYERISAVDNFRRLGASLATPTPLSALEPGHEHELARVHAERTHFVRMLGTFFWDPGSSFSLANQFSPALPKGPGDPTGRLPPPAEHVFPLAWLGLLPFLVLPRLPPPNRLWILCLGIALFCLGPVFLVLQWPDPSLNDLWVKRVQYVQAHVIFAVLMGLGTLLVLRLLHGRFPHPLTLGLACGSFALVFTAFPLFREFRNPRHHAQLGASSQRHNDLGWAFGHHLLRGIDGMLLDEIAHQKDPPCLLDARARTRLGRLGFAPGLVEQATHLAGEGPLPLSSFRRRVLDALPALRPAQRGLLRDSALLAAFRAAPPSTLHYLPSLPPDFEAAPELEPDAIYFGGTDPGRFVPTYMAYSAEVRPDLHILTQNALAHAPYLDAMRDLYGDRIWIPSLLDLNDAFRAYADQLRVFDPAAHAALTDDGAYAVTGVAQVNEINALLSRQLHEANQDSHAFYVEESYLLEWMTPHLRPHGLLFRLEATPVTLSPAEIERSHAFWHWYSTFLLAHPAYARDPMACKAFSKLRLAQAWNLFERGHTDDALAAMEQALRLHPANPETVFRFADLLTRLLRFDDAAALVDDYAPHDPDNPQLHSFRRTLATLRDLDARRRDLEAAFDRGPTGNLSLQLLQIYGHLEQTGPMRDMAELLLHLPNLSPDFHIHLAAFLRQRRETDLYLRALEAWATGKPEDPRPCLDLAAAALSRRDYSSAFQHMLHAIERDPIGARITLTRDSRFRDIAHWRQFQRLVAIPDTLRE